MWFSQMAVVKYCVFSACGCKESDFERACMQSDFFRYVFKATKVYTINP